MKIVIFCLLLASCSSKEQEQNSLPNYSDMGAAADAGKVVSPPVPEGL